MDDSYNNKGYYIRFDNIVADSFNIDGKTHYVSGAFKYRNMSLKDNSNNTPTDFTADTTYTFFNSYNIAQDDPSDIKVRILSHTWKTSYVRLFYTFRIQEDFSQYYQLISQAQNSYGNLLSKKKLSIGNIFLFGD